jgi:hypothetical protein
MRFLAIFSWASNTSASEAIVINLRVIDRLTNIVILQYGVYHRGVDVLPLLQGALSH